MTTEELKAQLQEMNTVIAVKQHLKDAASEELQFMCNRREVLEKLIAYQEMWEAGTVPDDVPM